MQAVGVGVGEDDDLAVAQAGEVVPARVAADGDGEVVHFLRGEHLPGRDFQVLRILPRSGRIAWKSLVARLARALPPARIALRPGTASVRERSCEMQSASLPGRAGPCVTFLRDDLLSALEPRRRAFDRELRDPLAGIDVRVQPQRERIVRGALDEARGLARAQAFLGLSAELRVGHLQREHEGDAVPRPRARADAARQQVAEIAELTQRIGEAAAQSR